MADDEGDLLVLLLDTAVFSPPPTSPDDDVEAHVATPEAMLSQVLAFTNAYALLNKHNQLVVYALHAGRCELIHRQVDDPVGSSSSNSSNTGGGASSAVPSPGIHANLRRLVLSSSSEDAVKPEDPPATSSSSSTTQPAAPPPPEVLLSGALSRALCLIHRLKTCPSRVRSRSKPRILVLLGSPDVSMQYIPVMNAIFSAQRADVAVDACVTHGTDSAFLQQAAHLTGGLYLKPKHAAGLYQYLCTFMACDTHCRSLMNLPQATGVDFRASCFCHKRAIDLGFVCSVCLSIFCQELPACSTCGTAFGLGRRAAAAPAGAGQVV
ncbi:MAG: hypothetical protein WDW38_002523 [Sanguina aurantia]